jgi:hypothetical protein
VRWKPLRLGCENDCTMVEVTRGGVGGGAGKAQVEGRRVVMTIFASQIGDPAQFRWSCEAIEFGDGRQIGTGNWQRVGTALRPPLPTAPPQPGTASQPAVVARQLISEVAGQIDERLQLYPELKCPKKPRCKLKGEMGAGDGG